MKKFGDTGVPRFPPQPPWCCQPLFAKFPDGAVVFTAGSAVSSKMTAEAGKSAKQQMPISRGNFFIGTRRIAHLLVEGRARLVPKLIGFPGTAASPPASIRIMG